jgi:hypothetical protein
MSADLPITIVLDVAVATAGVRGWRSRSTWRLREPHQQSRRPASSTASLSWSATAKSISPSTWISWQPGCRLFSMSRNVRILSDQCWSWRLRTASRARWRGNELKPASAPQQTSRADCRGGTGEEPKTAARTLKMRHQTPPEIKLLLRRSPQVWLPPNCVPLSLIRLDPKAEAHEKISNESGLGKLF